jgi:hypothetical protein
MIGELPTRRYSQIRGLRRRGLMGPASGPCVIDGCDYSYPGRVYDHCHVHDYIRGVLCLWHNGGMRLIDAHVALETRRGAAHARETAARLAHWARCPECTASGEWQPYQTALEYEHGQIIKTLIDLADELAGRKPPRRESPNVVPLRDQLASLESYLRRHPEIMGGPNA